MKSKKWQLMKSLVESLFGSKIIASNFFLEVNGPKGCASVVNCRAVYDGAKRKSVWRANYHSINKISLVILYSLPTVQPLSFSIEVNGLVEI